MKKNEDYLNDEIYLYCDGSCTTPGSYTGGWACVLKWRKQVKELSGNELKTTSQRMELYACIKGLEAIKVTTKPIRVMSDSNYLVKCFTEGWYKKWMNRGYMDETRAGCVTNADLWKRLIALNDKFNITFQKVAGHSGVTYNERCDRLANRERLAIESTLKGNNRLFL